MWAAVSSGFRCPCIAGLIFWRLSWRCSRWLPGRRRWVGSIDKPLLRRVTSARVLLRAPGSAGVVGDELAGCARGGVEGVVPRCQQHVVAFEVQRACEVDGVVAAQGMLCGEFAGLAGEWFVDRDDAQLGVEIFERGDRVDVRRFIDPAGASSRCECGACLGVDEQARDEEVGSVPELDGELGAGFVEDQLDQRRRIEVDDQRRWSATRSDTGLAAFNRARSARG